METKTYENGEFESSSAPLYSIRWAAVFAGFIVGLGVHLLMLLIGAAAGFAVYGAGQRPDGSSISIAAALWNGGSLLVAALIGGYVAARSSGLRRTPDGVLHAVASWGVSMIFYAFLAGSVAGNTLSGAFGMTLAAGSSAMGSESAVTELLEGLERGDRDATVRSLRDRFGMGSEQAERAADRAISLMGSPSSGTSGARRELNENISGAARTVSAASAWLSLAILLSLGAGAGGGLWGARGARNRSLHGRHRERIAVRTPAVSGSGYSSAS